MKYVANPVTVDACEILDVSEHKLVGGALEIYIPGPEGFGVAMELSAEQIARYTPVKGDYLVTAGDNYVYVNPKAVFEKKYTLVADQPTTPPPVAVVSPKEDPVVLTAVDLVTDEQIKDDEHPDMFDTVEGDKANG